MFCLNSMKIPTLLCLSLAHTVWAQNNGLPISGANKPGIGNTPEALQVSEAAGRRPNATTIVTFTRTYNNTPETWAWRVNLTEIAVPDQLSDLGLPSANFSQGLHVANTQWQLNWPGSEDDSLQAFLKTRNMSLSLTTLISNKPSNITSRYNDMDNGNCTALLGDQCTRSLTQAAASNNSTISFLGLEGCGSTLLTGNGGQDGGASFDINPTEGAFDTSDANILQREDTFFYRASKTYVAGDLTVFHQSESALQLLIMKPHYGADPRGDSSGPTVLCRIIETADASTAASQHVSAAILWATALFSAFIGMW